MEGYERLKSVGGGGRYDALATDGRTTYPGVGISFGVSRTLLPLLAEGVLSRQPRGAERRPGRAGRRGEPTRQRADRRRAAPPRHRLRGRAAARRSTASRSAYAERRGIPFVWFPARSRTAPDQVKDIRSGDQVDADPATWTPARRRPPPPRISTLDTHPTRRPAHPDPRRPPVIRTHDAGTLTARQTSGRPSPSPAGWPAGATTAGSPSSTCARPAASPRSSIRDEAVAHSLRSEYCLKVTGEVPRAPRATPTRHLPSGEIEVIAADVEVLNPSAVLPFPIDDAGRTRVATSARRRACAPLPRPATHRPGRRDPPAQQGEQGRPRRARRPRLRRDRDADPDPVHPRGRPRLPGAGPAAARAAGTPCRRARSCSSSC